MNKPWIGMMGALALAAISNTGPSVQRGGDSGPMLLAQMGVGDPSPNASPVRDRLGRDIDSRRTGEVNDAVGNPGIANERGLGDTTGDDIGRAGSISGTRPGTAPGGTGSVPGTGAAGSAPSGAAGSAPSGAAGSAPSGAAGSAAGAR